ncbi:MAG: XdhC family protein [Candidatus Acidiferrales bacterium]
MTMSAEYYSKIAELAAARKSFATATVVRVEGSSSAKPGAKAIIDENGRILLGWVGGGCAESAVRTEALRCIAMERPELIRLDMMDELAGVGMPCGGKMDVYVEPVLPQPELLIVGHGRISETLATLGALMEFSITVNDPGAEAASFPKGARVVNEDFDFSATPIGERTYVVIATLHKNDHVWLEKALESRAAYVALIASRHRTKIVLDLLSERGSDAARLDSVWAPAGLDLGAATPEEIALSIVSQIVALRRGGTAGALRDAGAGENHTAAERVIYQCEVEATD